MMPGRAGIQSVEVGYAVLDALASAPDAMMLRDLAAACAMSAAKAHRYLVSFQRVGLVAQDPATSRYDLGPTARRLGLASLARLDGLAAGRAAAARLCEAIGHTTALAVWSERGPIIVHCETPSCQPLTIGLRLGSVMPLSSSATGRCFAAWLPREQIAAVLTRELGARPARPLARLATGSGWATWAAAVRARGAGTADGDPQPGLVTWCHPVFDATGRLVLGLVTLGPSAAFDGRAGGMIDRAAHSVAAALSREFGGADAGPAPAATRSPRRRR
ncbi:IclR family transcriptional regulator [Methylibium petroleiphilum]|uniref:IclR family transcriptional regulator n=1 Tax=Methylibium petroleiphilum TaxID=105560 RepID=UPI001AC0DB53|nr:helix-turn-helix domain-containing protein [Methylibium petroleiphilum]